MAGSIQSSSSIAQAIASTPAVVTAEDLAKSDLWIFREGRRQFSGLALVGELRQRLSAENALLDCLIQAGELEAALADVGVPDVSDAMAITDALAQRLCAGQVETGDLANLAGIIQAPENLSVSPPEGFTYYALHPLDFVNAGEQISNCSTNYAVLGIRSIGTTLSAVIAAEMSRLGKKVSRITVRPQGHPYSRITIFSPREQAWIAEQQSRSAQFVIVDEGPGRSGSTFLSVAEALCRAGIAADQIVVVGSREFDPSSLCAQGAAERWQRFRFVTAPSSLSRRFTGFRYIGGGDWRQHFCDGELNWPESWTQMERFKVLSADRSHFIKFEGMGRIGKEARDRAFALAKAGFSPVVSDIGDGFLSYATINGKSLQRRDLNAEVLENIARYCTFRAAEFSCTAPRESELEQMLIHNVREEFGREIKVDPGLLSLHGPVLADGRMQPHEWIASSGKIIKTDAVSHGDNHFFPGPCGIAWDLAGTIIEWDLGTAATEFLVARFQQLSGANASLELDAYILAYCVFRLGFCKMARSTVQGTAEELRLHIAYQRYRAKAAQLLEKSSNESLSWINV
ncbi:MAG TPA: hypothetical protein VFA90_06730 [Terriglobales bacterium]|nr:hypothetical protein [Terriglobales bacterium]